SLHELKGLPNGVYSVEFSADGSRLISERLGERMVWDTATGKRIYDESPPESNPSPPRPRDLNPNVRWKVVTEGDTVFLFERSWTPDADELGYRQWATRSDPDWHRGRAGLYEKEQQWFAAAFHLSRLIEAEPQEGAHYLRRGQALAAQ